MSRASVRKVMLENQFSQLDEVNQKYVRAKTIEFKKMLECGTMHRLAFDLAQIEIDIELENEI